MADTIEPNIAKPIPIETIKETPQFNLELPEVDFQLVSLVELGTVVLLSIVTYYLLKKLSGFLKQLSFFDPGRRGERIVSGLTIGIPIFIFVYGFSLISRESLLLTLGLFIVLSLVFGFSLIAPARSFFSTLIFKMRGDIREGDFIEIGDKKGRVSKIGPFNIVLATSMGDRILVPASEALQTSISIRKSGSNPVMTFEVKSNKPIQHIESLAHLCPYKKDETDLTVAQKNGVTYVTMEVISREHRSEINHYFAETISSK